MTAEFQLDETVVDRIAALPAVREAARAAAALIALWPLTDAMQMDNDAKYAENLQVRITRTMAAMMTGEDVTVPDAEYVYEGADWIPGRPQTIVDALLAANDAYDMMADYSETGDVTLVTDAAAALGDAGAADNADVRAVLEAVETSIAPKATDEGHVPPSGDEDEIARRFAIVMVACETLFRVLAGQGAADAARALPVILYANELGRAAGDSARLHGRGGVPWAAGRDGGLGRRSDGAGGNRGAAGRLGMDEAPRGRAVGSGGGQETRQGGGRAQEQGGARRQVRARQG